MSKEKNSTVDVHNEALMVELGIHPPKVASKDPNVWNKTPKERKLLKALRKSHKGTIHFNSIPDKVIPVQAKLIIQLKKNNKFPNTTYSYNCWMHQIDEILSHYSQYNTSKKCNETLVNWYAFNGQKYNSGDRPFWFS